MKTFICEICGDAYIGEEKPKNCPFCGAREAFIKEGKDAKPVVEAKVTAQIKGGKIRGIAVTGLNRSAVLPELPTVAESGFSGFEAYSWIGIFAPAATPASVVSKLTDDFKATLNNPEVHGKLTAGGFEVMATDGPGVDRYAREQYERWSAFVRETHIKLEQ